METYRQIKEQMQADIRTRIDFSREVSDEEIAGLIDEIIIRRSKQQYFSIEDRVRLKNELFYSIRKLDILQELVDDNSVTEIMVNGIGNVFIERAGHLMKWDKCFESVEKLQDVIQQIVAKSNRVVNESSPIVDARLENGSRVNVVLPPVALNGPILTIRRFPDKPIGMEDLIRFGSVTPEAVEFLRKLVICGYNIFISGGTGSGKTTFLNALSNFIPSDERVITIEDSAELQIQDVPNLVRLETRNANTEGCVPITIRDLIRSSLRMRPDRIIVGEVRGAEAMELLSAMNTGHDGSISTGHANSSEDMLARLETMVLMGIELPLSAIRRQLASGIDIIVHLGRLRDKSRRVLEICEVMGVMDGEVKMEKLYEFKEESVIGGRINGSLVKTGSLKNREKLHRGGMSLEGD
ncbi:MAG: CpaF family protein [Lachnospiraceae bacterium]|nr:CpaF family protein [Lachnospiraceae bacterium]